MQASKKQENPAPDLDTNPDHIIDEDYAAKEYRGNLAEDCKAAEPESIAGMVQGMENLSALIQGRAPRTLSSDFASVFGDGKSRDAEREAHCGGHYSRMARGER